MKEGSKKIGGIMEDQRLEKGLLFRLNNSRLAKNESKITYTEPADFTECPPEIRTRVT